MSRNTICFPSSTFVSTSLVIVVAFIGFIVCYKAYEDKRFEEFCKLKMQTVANSVSNATSNVSKTIKTIVQFPDNYNDRMPERRYVGPYDYSESSQQVGFIYKDSDRFPLYENRQGRNYYYHIKDDSRNGIRILINDTPKHEQLSNGDSVTVPELNGDYTIKLYEYSGNRYNPFVY